VNRRYQRKLVWTLPEKQHLVSSVLNRYPIPAVLLAERDDGYEIIDGLQRLYTLTSFVETAFPTLEGGYFDVSEFVTAKNRRDEGVFSGTDSKSLVDATQVAKFLDYPLAVSIMRGASEAEIDEVFSRINTYGHRLSDQERRQAGVQGDFSETVRILASELRGDVSSDILNLAEMPQISIDLPKMKHGYAVQAEQVFWVQHGILSAGNLRDSLDEQCIADILASLVGGQIIERSKEALDRVYDSEDSEAERIARGLDTLGSSRIIDEFKYCVQEILRACQVEPKRQLSAILGVKNPFPSVFAVILIAFHESLISERKKIANIGGVRKALEGLYSRLETSRRSTLPVERRKNVDTIKGLLADNLVIGSVEAIYSNASVIDIDALIRRSQIETPRYELKQGLLNLSDARELNSDIIARVIATACGIANCGPDSDGVILIGVTDKGSDATRIEELDQINPRKLGNRHVVGIAREAAQLDETVETYVGRWKTAIRNSALSEKLKSDILSSVDYNEYFGLGVLVLRIPRQASPSFVGDTMYMREGDETKEVLTAPQVANVANRFKT
jgi:Protein of unknown function DUF262